MDYVSEQNRLLGISRRNPEEHYFSLHFLICATVSHPQYHFEGRKILWVPSHISNWWNWCVMKHLMVFNDPRVKSQSTKRVKHPPLSSFIILLCSHKKERAKKLRLILEEFNLFWLPVWLETRGWPKTWPQVIKEADHLHAWLPLKTPRESIHIVWVKNTMTQSFVIFCQEDDIRLSQKNWHYIPSEIQQK